MKNILSSSLILLSAIIVSPAMAAEISPHDLVFQGYQGRLKSSGIPGYAAFCQAVFLGKIEAETLIQGAIAQEKLDSSLAKDETYLNEVQSYLSLLRVNGSGR
jgi:hypothetical protein